MDDGLEGKFLESNRRWRKGVGKRTVWTVEVVKDGQPTGERREVRRDDY